MTPTENNGGHPSAEPKWPFSFEPPALFIAVSEGCDVDRLHVNVATRVRVPSGG